MSARRRQQLRNLIAVPGAPQVWDFQKYGDVLCKYDYQARLMVRVLPGFWELWINTLEIGVNAAARRTTIARQHSEELPESFRKTPELYYVRCGAKWAAEYIRWGFFVQRVEEVNDEFMFPNANVAYLSRLALKEHPDWAPLIETAECRTAIRDNGKTHRLVLSGNLPTP